MQNTIINGPDTAPGNDGLAALNKNDFAARYDVSKRTLDGWLAAGCPHLKLSSRMVRIPVKEGDLWVKENFLQQRRKQVKPGV